MARKKTCKANFFIERKNWGNTHCSNQYFIFYCERGKFDSKFFILQSKHWLIFISIIKKFAFAMFFARHFQLWTILKIFILDSKTADKWPRFHWPHFLCSHYFFTTTSVKIYFSFKISLYLWLLCHNINKEILIDFTWESKTKAERKFDPPWFSERPTILKTFRRFIDFWKLIVI